MEQRARTRLHFRLVRMQIWAADAVGEKSVAREHRHVVQDEGRALAGVTGCVQGQKRRVSNSKSIALSDWSKGKCRPLLRRHQKSGASPRGHRSRPRQVIGMNVRVEYVSNRPSTPAGN